MWDLVLYMIKKKTNDVKASIDKMRKASQLEKITNEGWKLDSETTLIFQSPKGDMRNLKCFRAYKGNERAYYIYGLGLIKVINQKIAQVDYHNAVVTHTLENGWSCRFNTGG